ncbi:hypothetical protein SDC9_179584 [bioreactor metagenome]|uniref:Uncharacterized protein n=1 Tax=bioreactor metagenome TaxID=1076179 RepID=A0A645GZE5_9ZZZZ
MVLPAVDTTALLYSRSTSAQGFAEKLYSISNKVFEDISLITAQSEKIEKLNKLADALNAIMSDKTFKTEDGKDNISNSCVVGDNIPALKVTADQIVTEIKVIGELVAQLKLQITSIKEACDDYNQNQEK